MKHNHDLIADLLPLYVDGVCSSKSDAAIREHLDECAACRALMDELQLGAPIEPPHLNGSDVLEKAGRDVTREAVFNVVGIAVIVLYWVLYAVINHFANVGDYRFFPYFIWEIWSIGFIIMPFFNAIWLLVVMRNAAKNKQWKKRRAMLLILVVLLAGQVGIEYVTGQEMSTTSLGWVEQVSQDGFVFVNGDGPMQIACSPELTGLLKADGTMYIVSYQHNRLFPGKATLSQAQDAGYNRTQTSAWMESHSK